MSNKKDEQKLTNIMPVKITLMMTSAQVVETSVTATDNSPNLMTNLTRTITLHDR